MNRSRSWIAALAAVLLPASALAQSVLPQLPPSAVLTNYDRVLIGQEEALESGAFVARVADTTAGWYNPAGLANVERSIIGASATGYELEMIDLGAIQTSTGRISLAQLPAFFGAVLGSDVLHSDAWRIGFTATKPTSWSAAVNGATVEGSQIVYSSRVSISTLVPAVSAAWAPWRFLRLGAGLGVAITSIAQTQVLSVRGSDPSLAAAALRTADGTGTTWGGQLSFGVQWDVSENLVAGASVRTPTLSLFQTGSLAYESLASGGTSGSQVYFRDPSAEFAYRLPLTVNFGLAWRASRFEAEVDVRFHSAIPAYALLSSNQPVETVTTGPDGLPVHTFTPFSGLIYGATAIWNVAAGGHYKLDEFWSFHAGVYSDAAPVAPEGSNLFRSVNLWGATAGAKLKGAHLSGSLGLGFCWGNSDDFLLGAPGEPGAITTRLAIRNVSLLYAIAYTF
jgi:long-subunit fatty acid transport protein